MSFYNKHTSSTLKTGIETTFKGYVSRMLSTGSAVPSLRVRPVTPALFNLSFDKEKNSSRRHYILPYQGTIAGIEARTTKIT